MRTRDNCLLPLDFRAPLRGAARRSNRGGPRRSQAALGGHRRSQAVTGDQRRSEASEAPFHEGAFSYSWPRAARVAQEPSVARLGAEAKLLPQNAKGATRRGSALCVHSAGGRPSAVGRGAVGPASELTEIRKSLKSLTSRLKSLTSRLKSLTSLNVRLNVRLKVTTVRVLPPLPRVAIKVHS